MKIITINRQNRRDFWADFECEGCGHIEKDVRGYDDRNFHDNVIPKQFRCPECEKTREDLGVEGEYWETKYPEGFQI